MGHLSQIEAVMEAYDDILYHYPDDGEDTLNMPKKEVIVKQKADFNYWAIHSGVCMPEIDLEHEFEREAIKGLDDFIENFQSRDYTKKIPVLMSYGWLTNTWPRCHKG